MSRRMHISVALSAFALGLVLTGAAQQLPHALPGVVLAGLLLSALWKRVRDPAFDTHGLKVASVTLALWVLIVGGFSAFVLRPTSDYIALEDDYLPAEEAAPAEAVEAPPPAHVEWDIAEPCWFGAAASVSRDANVIWAGAIDRKAVRKPSAFYPPEARARDIGGEVPVEVLVDGSGRVVVARPVGGHSLLRREAARAACNARFSPMLVDGVPPHVSGLLTYHFGR